MSPPHYCKAFLVAAHGSMDVGGSIRDMRNAFGSHPQLKGKSLPIRSEKERDGESENE